MSRLDLPRRMPAHLALPLDLALQAGPGPEGAACVLYAAHRLLRLALAGRDGPAAEALLSLRLADLAAALAAPGGDGPIPSIAAALADGDGRKAIDDLVAAADLVLDPGASGTDDLAAELSAALERALATIPGLGVRTAGPDRPGLAFDWTGPRGFSTEVRACGCAAPSTLVTLADADAVTLGPATPGGIPVPLLPLATLAGRAALELPDGTAVDRAGRIAAPLAALTAGRALGRLVAWHLAPDADPAKAAEALAKAGHADAAGEVLLLGLAARAPDWTPDEVERARDFLRGHGLDDAAAALDAWLEPALESDEAARREAGDWRGVSNVLLLRQQSQEGAAKATTLVRLANLFRERLDDREGSFWCLLSAIEFSPGDASLVHEVAEESSAVGHAADAATRLLDVARGQRGATRAALAGAAARLKLGLGDAAGAFDALGTALEASPDDPELLDEAVRAAQALGDGERMLVALRRVRDAATSRAARLDATLGAALVCHQALGRDADAIDEYRQALALDPNHREALDAMLDLQLATGQDAEALHDAALAAARAWEPAVRGHALRRLATLMRKADDAAGAAGALAEATALDPADAAEAEDVAALYAELGDARRAIAALRRAAVGAPDRAVALLLRAADLASGKLSDPEAALGFLAEAAARDPNDAEPPRRVRALHEALGLWADVARDLATEASQAEGARKAEALLQLAGVRLDRLGQRERGKDTLRWALQAAAGAARAPIARQLAALHRDDGEREAELAALEALVPHLAPDEACDLLAMMGHRALEAPPDPPTARRHLEAAVRLNPVHPAAVEALAGLLVATEAERVVPLVEPLALRATEAGDTVAEHRLRRTMAEAAARMNDLETAIALYSRCAELEPADVATRLVLGHLDARTGRDAEAVALLDRVLADHPDELTPAEQTDLLLTTARSLTRLGEHPRALDHFEQAWRLGGRKDPAVLREVVASAEAGKDARKLSESLESLLKLESGPARFALLLRLGDLWKDDLGDPVAALAWYRAARDENATSKAALHKVLDASVAAGDFAESKRVLVGILDLEQDGTKRAQYHFASAMLARDNLGDPALTREHLWKVIELEPEHEEALAALEALLVAADDQEGLASLFKLLARHHRLTGSDRRMLDALRRLASCYEERLHNLPLAAETLRQILQAAPDDAEAAGRLADVLTRTPGREADALEAHRAAVVLDPTRVASYRSIRDLCIVTAEEDGAWCAAGALAALGEAADADSAAFEAGRQSALRLKRDNLPHEAFRRLVLDPEADAGVARVLELLVEPLRRVIPWKSAKDLGISEADRVDLAAKGMFQSMLLAASRVFGVAAPAVYRARGRTGLAKLPFDPPALAVGDDVLETWRGKELRFATTRALVSFTPGWGLAGISDAGTLRIFFLSALKIAFPDFPVPGDAEGVDTLAGELERHLSPDARVELHSILAEFRREKKAVDLPGFLAGVDRSATRAGLFMANDIVIARNLLADETLFLSDLEWGDRLTDLCAWLVSARSGELRKMMLQL